ncbi:hypothetical protein K7432_007980 [Basidiobolus ranarum]|uniref:Uncharacterized protein n=1 Tax=Basidiobolus ranarum TaxID=34480 RepID=A0ABR2VZI2_9FUNG
MFRIIMTLIVLSIVLLPNTLAVAIRRDFKFSKGWSYDTKYTIPLPYSFGNSEEPGSPAP